MRICEDCAAFATPDAAACTECDSPHIRKPMPLRECSLSLEPEACPAVRDWLEGMEEEYDR